MTDMKKSFIFVFLWLLCLGVAAQNISVKSFKALPMDLTASSLEGKRVDQNGDVAALIKVVTTETGFVFEGGTLGIVDTKQTPGEVWVWVPRAARKITIKHPKLGVLRDYYYPVEIEAERTYEMVLTTAKIETIVKEEVTQQYLIFELEPKNATLEVNDQLWSVDADGTALQFVDLGTYTYRVRAANYETDAGVVTVDDPDPDHPKTVKVKLKSNFAEVTLTVDADAEIWVNNDKKGVHSWTGSLGKGTYKIECKQKGHETSLTTKEITAAMNGQTITLSAPVPIYGSLNVESTPIGATIYIDGKEIGKTPRYINEVLIGQRALRLMKEGYEEYSETVTITKGERKQVKATLTTSGRDVRFVCSAPYSQLKIDEQNMGSASGTYKLQDGRHSIFVTADGYHDFSGYVEVDANANYFTIDMRPETKDEETFTVNGVSFTMKLVEGGTFQMGSSDSDADSDEKSVHSVTLSSYYIGETEVTQALWKAVMGNNPSYFKGDNLPVESVSWNDCQEFIRKLNQKTGKNFRLPTEAEWEFAARGGAKTSLYNGENIIIRGKNNSPNLDALAWYGGNCGRNYTIEEGCDVSNGDGISGWDEKQYSDSKGGTHPVKKKQPNAYGLYDMLGNVWEWCSDWYGSDYYGKSPSTNPKGPSSGSYRVLRGGSWYDRAGYCRVSNRDDSIPDYTFNGRGFRLCLPQ